MRATGPTVRGALRRALLAGHLTRREHDALRRSWRWAETSVRELPAARAAELRGVLRAVEDLAARRKLTAGRLPLAFLTVRTNVAALREEPLPRTGARRLFGRDPRVWQHVGGQGWQVHQLATAGRANGLAQVCLAADSPYTCRPAALRRTLDALVASAGPRSSFVAWESLFWWGGARPGWISGMTQATAIQALTRGAAALRATGDDGPRPARLRDLARRALRAFERRPPVGVARPTPGGRTFLLYSDLPDLRVVNGHLQAMLGLREAAQRGLSARAGRAYRRGLRAVAGILRSTDTGAWSRYAVGGAEATLHYHRLTTSFLRKLCHRTERGLFCAPARRFARYERQRPRLAVRPAGAGAVTVWVSKISTVRVRVVGPRGTVLDVARRLPRGAHRVAWRAAAPGRYAVSARAVGLDGTVATAGAVTTAAPRRPPRGRPRKATKSPEVRRARSGDAGRDRARRASARRGRSGGTARAGRAARGRPSASRR
jgi:hypothetical protein